MLMTRLEVHLIKVKVKMTKTIKGAPSIATQILDLFDPPRQEITGVTKCPLMSVQHNAKWQVGNDE